MAPLPVEVLLGIYLGLLVGVLPALVSWVLGFVFKYLSGVTLPGFGVTVLAIALAGVNGGLLALADQSITQSPNAPRIVTAIIVVAMLAMYAHSKGDQMAVTFPRRLSLKGLRERTLALDLADVVAGRDEVRIHVTGQVVDMEGYPPLPDELRAEIRDAEFTLPSGLAIDELERRVAEQLRTEYDVAEVTVRIDERGRAAVVAAPPFSGLSKRVGSDRRAVSVDCLVPSGLARGDEVTLVTPEARIRGTIVSARSDGTQPPVTPPVPVDEPDDDPEAEDRTEPAPRAPTTAGGDGQVTVAVPRSQVSTLVGTDRARVIVESRGTRREYELVSLLRRADHRFRRLTVAAGSQLDGASLGGLRVRDTYGVAVLGIRSEGGWTLAPAGDTTLSAGNQIYVVGTRDALGAFEEAMA